MPRIVSQITSRKIVGANGMSKNGVWVRSLTSSVVSTREEFFFIFFPLCSLMSHVIWPALLAKRETNIMQQRLADRQGRAQTCENQRGIFSLILFSTNFDTVVCFYFKFSKIPERFAEICSFIEKIKVCRRYMKSV